MKLFKINVTQELTGYYEGTLEILANSKIEAEQILDSMTNKMIDDNVEWEHGDEYYGDINTIEFTSTLEEYEK